MPPNAATSVALSLTAKAANKQLVLESLSFMNVMPA